MSDYAIGDIQGCYDALQRLLDKIDFDENVDKLWFVGDLVNRGPASLAVLRFIKALPIKPNITLGNHDLHLLSVLFADNPKHGHDDTLEEIIKAPDAQELGYWLRHQSLLCHSPELKVVMCHAGIAPMWDLATAKALAKELESVLSGDNFRDFLNQMYGNKPECWSDELTGMDRLRVITNYFTRMRFCDAQGGLDFHYKGTLEQAPSSLYPWYAVPNRKTIDENLVFGHWAALMGLCPVSNYFAIDTGCLWGGTLTALRLQDKKRFST